MKLPMSAPNIEAAMQKIYSVQPNRLFELMSAHPDDSRYMHWDELRYKTPPEAMTLEEWWLSLKFARRSQYRAVDLSDKNGQAFQFTMTDRLLKQSEQITRRASGQIRTPDDVFGTTGRNQYIVRSLVEEAITSSQLEGASTSRRVAIEMLDSKRDPRNKSELMIYNNYQAMERIRTSLAEPLTTEFVLELHRILTDGTLEDPSDAGRLETLDHQRVAVWDNEICVHEPPSADQLPQRLQALCDFANGDTPEGAYIPPVVRAVIVDFMVGYDHYFADGNGRTARALFYWCMLKQEYWLSEYVAISKIFKKAPSRYSTAYLLTEDDERDLTYFIHYQLDVFIRALDELDDHLQAKVQEAADIRSALASKTVEFNFRQAEILEKLARDENERVSVRQYRDRFRVSHETARADLNDLTKHGYLTKQKVGRSYLWRPTPQLINKLSGKIGRARTSS